MRHGPPRRRRRHDPRFVRRLRRDGRPLPGRLPRSRLGTRGQLHRRRAGSCAEGSGEIPGAAASTDFSAALAAEIDAVIISSPNHLHHRRQWPRSRPANTCCCRSPWRPSWPMRRRSQQAAERSTRTVGALHELLRPAADPRSARHGPQRLVGDIVHCYARLMHKGGMMWSDEALAGEPELARQRRADRRRLLHPTRRALHPHLRMGHRRKVRARHRLRAQSALSRTRR